MKTSLILFAVASAPLISQAALVTLPAASVIGTSPDGINSPNLAVNVPFVANVSANTTTFGTTSGSGWTAGGRGSISVDALSGLAGVDLQTRTVIGPSSITFTTDSTTSGVLGGLIGNVVGPAAGLNAVQTWSASANATTLGLTFNPSTTYALTFNLGQSTSLLGALSPSVFNNFTVTVGDSDSTFGQGALPAGLLGITDILNGSGSATLTFTTDAVINGPISINFGASAVADTALLTSLLGNDATLYTISGLNVNQIPEPSSVAMLGGLVGMMTLIRRRSR